MDGDHTLQRCREVTERDAAHRLRAAARAARPPRRHAAEAEHGAARERLRRPERHRVDRRGHGRDAAALRAGRGARRRLPLRRPDRAGSRRRASNAMNATLRRAPAVGADVLVRTRDPAAGDGGVARRPRQRARRPAGARPSRRLQPRRPSRPLRRRARRAGGELNIESKADHDRHARRALHQHPALPVGRHGAEGEQRPPGPAARRGADGLRAVDAPPQARPGASALARPRSLRPLGRARLGAALQPAAHDRLRRSRSTTSSTSASGAARRRAIPSAATPKASRSRPGRSARASATRSAWRSPRRTWRRATTATATRCSTTAPGRSSATAT